MFHMINIEKIKIKEKIKLLTGLDRFELSELTEETRLQLQLGDTTTMTCTRKPPHSAISMISAASPVSTLSLSYYPPLDYDQPVLMTRILG